MFQAPLLVFFGALLWPVLAGSGFERPFGCQGVSVNDEMRQGILNLINRIRSRVALGEFQAQNFLPSADDMNKLMWNCNLERSAEALVVSCPQNQPMTGSQNAVNYLSFGPGMPPSVPSSPIESAVLKWVEIGSEVWPTDNRFDGNPELRDFANLIRANSASVGCSMAKCGNRASVACILSQPSVTLRTIVYTAGNPCQNDGQCTRFNPGYCENGLCVNAARPATTTTTVAPTTPRRRSTDCPSLAFTTAFRETALGTHNNFRSLVARGLARNGEYANENAPPASRMDLLEYDCGAEQLALNHVKSCDRRLSPPASRPGYKENIHILETTATDILGALQNAVAMWNKELEANGVPSNLLLTPQILRRQQRTVTNVAKILWGTNKYVGCATQLCSGFYFTSCMYREPVNVAGQSIYSIGAVCSACPSGPNNCRVDIGLCSW